MADTLVHRVATNCTTPAAAVAAAYGSPGPVGCNVSWDVGNVQEVAAAFPISFTLIRQVAETDGSQHSLFRSHR